MTHREILERMYPIHFEEDPKALTDATLSTLARAGYAIVKADPQDDQTARALEAVGWVLVPREPTEAMVKAGADKMDPTWGYSDASVADEWAVNVYRAMVKAGGE